MISIDMILTILNKTIDILLVWMIFSILLIGLVIVLKIQKKNR